MWTAWPGCFSCVSQATHLPGSEDGRLRATGKAPGLWGLAGLHHLLDHLLASVEEWAGVDLDRDAAQVAPAQKPHATSQPAHFHDQLQKAVVFAV